LTQNPYPYDYPVPLRSGNSSALTNGRTSSKTMLVALRFVGQLARHELRSAIVGTRDHTFTRALTRSSVRHMHLCVSGRSRGERPESEPGFGVPRLCVHGKYRGELDERGNSGTGLPCVRHGRPCLGLSLRLNRWAGVRRPF